MTKTLEAKKMRLIARIIESKDESEVDALAAALRQFRTKRPRKTVVEEQIFRPMRKSISVEQLAREQGFKGIDRAAFDKLVADINLQEPVEMLLAQLTP